MSWSLSALLVCSTPALASPSWELCLDKADFRFAFENFTSSITAEKSGCRLSFAVSGGKGEKLEINLCDSQIHVDHYTAIDAASYRRVSAGSAGCPKPEFGADFEGNAREIGDYQQLRDRIFQYWNKIRDWNAKDADSVDLGNPASFSASDSRGRVACGGYLLREYLSNCMAFEPKKSELRDAAKPSIPGVHPQTILAPKSK